ncbi:MAG: glycoside hydrolase family 32 protein [Planctomycetota bacterium]|jgi:beta-fructofuranosidase
MKKTLSRRAFLKKAGFASVAIGCCNAFAAAPQSLPEPVLAYRRVVKSKDIETYSKAALNLRKWMIKNDPNYPTCHFVGPESWINDPNGPIYYEGRYHLFYQFDPQVDDGKGGWMRSKRTWGHAVSDDLVHWEDWPVAVWPDTRYDINGVYSGNTFVDANGDLCGLYTGNVAGHKETYGMLVRSKDEGATWEKKMVMDDSQRPNPVSPVHWDGQIWKRGNLWYQLIGGSTGGERPQGAAWLWTSPDLEKWTLQKNIAPSIKKSRYWELPYLIELDGKYVLFVGSGNPYWLGDFDYHNMIFTPDNNAPRSVDSGHYYSFNVNMTDNRGPGGRKRQLMHGWVRMKRPPKAPNGPYWEQAHTIPRVINVRNERLWQQPIREIEVLRGKHIRLAKPQQKDLDAVKGDCLEISASVKLDTNARLVLGVRASEDAKSYTPVYLDTGKKTFGIGDRSQSIDLPIDKPAVLRIFVDRSIIEAYVNGYAMTFVNYPHPSHRGLAVIERDAIDIRSMDIWEMKSMWDT